MDVSQIVVALFDTSGQVPSSDALPRGAPDLQAYASRTIQVLGNNSSGIFQISADIDAAEVVPPGIEVSPADGNFPIQQRFDAALLLQPGSTIASAQASVSGNALPLSYPGACQLAAPNSLGRPVILCPDAHTVLGTAAGAPIDWEVTLTDGTVLHQTAKWHLIQ